MSLFPGFEKPSFATRRTLNTAVCTTPYPGNWQLLTTRAGVPSAKWIRVYLKTGNQPMMTVYILTVTVAQVQWHKRWCMWEVVKHVPARHEACSPFCLLSLWLLFQDFLLTCAGVSVSFIGCPSNLNLICLISSPCREKRTLFINWPTQFYLHFGCFYLYVLLSNRFYCKLYVHGILSKYVFRECLLTFKSQIPDLTISTAQLSSQCSLRRKSGE